MGDTAAVGVHHKFAPGEPSIRFKAAKHKAPGGVDVYGIFIEGQLAKGWQNYMIHDPGA